MTYRKYIEHMTKNMSEKYEAVSDKDHKFSIIYGTISVIFGIGSIVFAGLSLKKRDDSYCNAGFYGAMDCVYRDATGEINDMDFD